MPNVNGSNPYRQRRAQMTPAQRRAENRKQAAMTQTFRNSSPEAARLVDRGRVDRVTLAATGGCDDHKASPMKRIGRAGLSLLNPAQHVGMLSRGASTLARSLGASPDVVETLDTPARLQTRSNVNNRRAATNILQGARNLADRLF